MHDVFPKARFRDCIAMTEKLGHQEQLRVRRKAWIDESKPKYQLGPEEDDMGDIGGLEAVERMEREQAGGPSGNDVWWIERSNGDTPTDPKPTENQPVEDEPLFVDDLGDVDIEEILQGPQKEGDTEKETTADHKIGCPEGDEFEDEMEVLNDMNDLLW
jgi:hypothetical protein